MDTGSPFKFGFDLASVTGNEGEQAADHSVQPGPTVMARDERIDNKRCIKKDELAVVDLESCRKLMSRKALQYEQFAVGDVEPLKKVLVSPSNDTSTCANASSEKETRSLIESENTDIIEGVYEGGLKVWECSMDLCQYLAEQVSRFRNMSAVPIHRYDGELVWNDCQGALSANGSTLEIGCGHGLPGCLIHRESLLERKRSDGGQGIGEGSKIMFSDYNEFVLRDATLPNIILNTPEILNQKEANAYPHSDQVLSGVSMVSGDWMELSSQLMQGRILGATEERRGPSPVERLPSNGRFDLVLAAETTYSNKATRDTAILLARHLKHETGVGLIATKRYYFGVGGGADALREVAKEELIEKEGCWDCSEGTKRRILVETIREYDNGSGNIRELLRVRLINGAAS
mmetsp:Transcript_12701/g.37383  ORF Transcript_12701/g.37383 Transcript_12701/m.37383 type:complete len:404 (-) Transcript_12701:35-1246(-)